MALVDITANAFNDVDAAATTNTGDSTADAVINEAFGINIDYSSSNNATNASLVSGESSTVTATADTSSTVIATTETGSATADNYLGETAGVEIATLTAGTSATTDGTAVFELPLQHQRQQVQQRPKQIWMGQLMEPI